MSIAYDFLKECGSFFVLTINGDYPAGRPFGALMEAEGDLFLSTNDLNQVHRQIREHGQIQIVAKKKDSRKWIRVTGVAEECQDPALRDMMMDENPALQEIFTDIGIEHFILLRVKVENIEIK